MPTLLRPRWLATVATPGVLEEHAVLMRDGLIEAVGPAADLLATHPDARDLPLPGHLLTPGLINAHTHAAMTLLRGVGDDLQLEAWLETRIWPIERALVSDAFVHDGTILACREMLLSGVTCFADMYFFPEAVARAALSMQMRAVVGVVVFDGPSAWGSGAADYLGKGLALRDQLAGEALLSFMLAPHAPYTVSDETFRRIASLAAELQLPVTTHLHETQTEIDESLARHGCRPVERLDRLGLLGPDFSAIHGVHLDGADLARLARHGASLIHCPWSNLKLATGIAPIGRAREIGLNVALGTDGAASNNQLDLLGEGRLATLLARRDGADPAIFDAAGALESLTLGGARTLGLAEKTGSIEPGKAADLAAFDLSAPEYGLVCDPLATLIHTAGRQALTDVWVAGQHVVRSRQIANPLSLEAVASVVGKSPLWHNQLGEFVSGRVG